MAKKFGGKKFHNKQYGGGIAIQSYNISDSAKRINEIVNNSIGAIKIIQKGESVNSKVSKVYLQTRTKKGTFKGYKRVSGIGFTLDKFNRLKIQLIIYNLTVHKILIKIVIIYLL